MAKFTKKKETKKETKTETKKRISPHKKYKFVAEINGIKYSKRTDDISETIMKLKPEILYCESYFTISEGTNVAERKLNLIQGKKLFNDDFFREVFITNLLLN